MNLDGVFFSADWTTLTNHLWQSTLSAAAIWLLTVALKKNRAAVRYWLWFAASFKFLVPFSALVALGSHLSWRTAALAVQPQWTYAIDNVIQPFATPITTAQISSPHASFNFAPILVAIWLCGVAVGVAFWLRCWTQVRRTCKNAVALPLGLKIPVLSSPSQIEPGVFGILKPVLLLPAGIESCLTPEQFDAILAHEMAHVRRRDNLTAAIHMFVETVFWFFPLVWWLRARLIEERELACDEAVLGSGSEAESYAEGIIQVCKSYVESPVACISGISGSDLKKRILRIVSLHRAENLTQSKKFVLAAIGLIAALTPLAIGLANAPLLRAQSDNGAIPPGVQLEAATIKLDAQAGPLFSSSSQMDPSHIKFTAISLHDLLYVAYGLQRYQLEAPDWTNAVRLDVEATFSGAKQTKGLVHLLQPVVVDRFKLTFHNETRSVKDYDLVVAPGGLKIKPSDKPLAAPTRSGPGGYHIDSAVMSTSFLASILSGNVGEPVFDKTNLQENYEFNLDFIPETMRMEANPPDGPSVFEAVEQQLGLKLQPSTAPVQIMVVDHVERKPIDNDSPMPPSSPAQPQADAAPPAFDAASVKPHQDTGVRNRTRSIEPGRITYEDVTLRELILVGYGVKPYQVEGPDWIQNNTYDIVATAGNAVGVEEVKRMLGPLLAERFHLVFHRETRELPVFALVVAKGGPKFKDPGDGGEIAFTPEPDGGESFKNWSMDDFAAWLSLPSIGRPVIDRTGLAGTFSFHANLFSLEKGTPADDLKRTMLGDDAFGTLSARRFQSSLASSSNRKKRQSRCS